METLKLPHTGITYGKLINPYWEDTMDTCPSEECQLVWFECVMTVQNTQLPWDPRRQGYDAPKPGHPIVDRMQGPDKARLLRTHRELLPARIHAVGKLEEAHRHLQDGSHVLPPAIKLRQ